MMYDPMYLIFMIPALILSGIAQWLVKSRFEKYSKVRARSGITGAEAARRLMMRGGAVGVRIERVSGMLTDHYDPTARVLRLSDAVYGESSLAAIGVACHEAGHAIQHARAYAPLKLRSTLVPVVNIGSKFGILLVMVGCLLNFAGLTSLGVLLFSATVLFALVTLPVEWDASARAKQLMVSAGIVNQTEERDAGSVLNAAFLTYVGAAVSSIGTLLYYLVRLQGMGRRR